MEVNNNDTKDWYLMFMCVVIWFSFLLAMSTLLIK